MSNAFGPKKPLFGPYTYRVKQNSNGDTLIAVYHGPKRIAHIDAFWAYSMRAIEEHEADEARRASGSGGGRGKRLVCASDLRALGAEGKYPNVLAVGHAFMDDDAYKGKGVGRAMYEAMMVEGFAVRQTRIGGQPGPMFFIPDECKGAGNTSAEAQRVWASLARDYPSQGTSIRVDAPPVIGSRAKVNPRRLRNGTKAQARALLEEDNCGGARDDYFYHVTAESRLDAIARYGLVPGKPANFANQSEYSAGKVFVSHGLSTARLWEAYLYDTLDEGDRPVILRIRPEAKLRSKVYLDEKGTEDAGCSFYVTSTIKPQHLEVLSEEEEERLPRRRNPRRRRNPNAIGNLVFTGPHAGEPGRKDEIRFYAEAPNPRYDPEEYYVIRGEKRWWEKPLRPVGHISVERDKDGVFSVGTVAVNAEYQRKGIAKRLYDMAWDYARAHGSGLRSGWVQSPRAAAYWESMVEAGKAEPYTDAWTAHNVTKKGWRRTRNPARSRRNPDPTWTTEDTENLLRAQERLRPSAQRWVHAAARDNKLALLDAYDGLSPAEKKALAKSVREAWTDEGYPDRRPLYRTPARHEEGGHRSRGGVSLSHKPTRGSAFAVAGEDVRVLSVAPEEVVVDSTVPNVHTRLWSSRFDAVDPPTYDKLGRPTNRRSQMSNADLRAFGKSPLWSDQWGAEDEVVLTRDANPPETAYHPNPRRRNPAVFDTLSPGTPSAVREQLQRLSRDDLARLQDELNALDDAAAARFVGMTRLWHGAPASIAEKIRERGFARTKGRRSGFLGATYEVDNLAIFLAEDKALAEAFGRNRTERYGEGTEVLEVYADLRRPLDMTVWAKVPKPLRVLGESLVQGYFHSKRPKQEDLYWLVDQPAFMDAVRDLGYDAVRFHEGAATVKSLGLARKGEVTVAVLDPARLHVAPPPRGSFGSLLWHLDRSRR